MNKAAGDSKDRIAGRNANKHADRNKISWGAMTLALLSAVWAFALLVALLAASICASYALGYVLAWLTGASKSPLGATVAPLIFGILAAFGVKASLKGPFSERWMIYRTIWTAILIAIFCYGVKVGFKWGIRSRMLPYDTVQSLLGPAWKDCDIESAAKIHSFRVKARGAGLSYQEYEPFMRDVVRPIIESDADNRTATLSRALAEMEGSFPKAEPKGDEKKPEPKEPAGEPSKAD